VDINYIHRSVRSTAGGQIVFLTYWYAKAVCKPQAKIAANILILRQYILPRAHPFRQTVELQTEWPDPNSKLCCALMFSANSTAQQDRFDTEYKGDKFFLLIPFQLARWVD
jgi:hypothetical protein